MAFRILTAFALLCLAHTDLVEARRLSLDGRWNATNTNKTMNFSAQVPGGIYTDLKRNGIIGEPYFSFNDIKYSWKAPTENTIAVKCQSPVLYALGKHETQAKSYKIYPICPPAVQNGQCHVNYLRKTQSSFSWDWGPSFPSQGIW
ncbi:unnamed protein product [Ixodes pacificus]